MTNMPGAEHAFLLMKEYRELNVGIHLVLGAGKPLCNDVPSLVNENGDFLKVKELFKYARVEDIEKEFECQMKRFLLTGFTPTHIDCHQHTHKNEEIMSIILKIADKYKLPARIFDKKALLNSQYAHIKAVDYFIGEFYGDNLTVEDLDNLLRLEDDNVIAELMCHPGYVDRELLVNSSYNTQRTNELSILTDLKAKEIINKLGIKLISYSSL